MPQCSECGAEVSEEMARCDSCGGRIIRLLPERFFLGTSISMAAAFGLAGFFGVGHMYIGKDRRGAALFALGVALLTTFLVSAPERTTVLRAVVILGFIVWVFQIFDAYRLTKQYNEYLALHGTAAW